MGKHMHNTAIRGLPVLDGVQHREIKMTERVRADAKNVPYYTCYIFNLKQICI